MLLSIPPKYSLSITLGYLKGKSAIRIHRELIKQPGTPFGRSFWSRGYCVSTVGLDERMIQENIQNQDRHERGQDQLELFE